MASLNTAWSITSSALRADQAALATVANNTANVSTPGYTQETVKWQESAPLEIGGSLVGTGVVDAGAISQRDRILNRAIDQQTQTQSATATRLSALDALQSTFVGATSSSGGAKGDITANLSGFFSSLQTLEASPSDASQREAVLAAANSLASSFNTAASSLVQQQDNLNNEVSATVTTINGITRSIASLNQQIQSSSPNTDAGTLEDQRQDDLQSLSALVGTSLITTDKNGMTVTTASGSPLVLGSQSIQVNSVNVGGVTHLYDGTHDITTELSAGGGSLGGLLEARDGDIPTAIASLDALAYAVGTAVNKANEGGTDANNLPGGAIFALPSSPAGSALTISVIVADPLKIAASATGAGIGDGSNAASMAAIAQQAIVNNETPSSYYAGFVSSIGDLTASVSANQTAQQAALSQLTSQQSSLSSVNLDAEATSLQNLEQAYQAASKVFSILNTLMGEAINLGTSTTV